MSHSCPAYMNTTGRRCNCRTNFRYFPYCGKHRNFYYDRIRNSNEEKKYSYEQPQYQLHDEVDVKQIAPLVDQTTSLQIINSLLDVQQSNNYEIKRADENKHTYEILPSAAYIQIPTNRPNIKKFYDNINFTANRLDQRQKERTQYRLELITAWRNDNANK